MLSYVHANRHFDPRHKRHSSPPSACRGHACFASRNKTVVLNHSAGRKECSICRARQACKEKKRHKREREEEAEEAGGRFFVSVRRNKREYMQWLLEGEIPLLRVELNELTADACKYDAPVVNSAGFTDSL